MRQPDGVTLVLNYRPTSTYSLNALVGAIETTQLLDQVAVRFAESPAELASQVARVAREKRPVVVAWSFYSPDFSRIGMELARLRKRVRSRHVLHLAGGVHASAEPEQTLRAGFDFVAVGEGEKTIVRFLDRLLSGGDPSDTPGIAALRAGRCVVNGSAERVNLNDFPAFPVKHDKFNPIELTRGCIYSCKFCQTPFLFKARFRHRSVENVRHHVQILVEHELRDIRFITPSALSYGSIDASVRLDQIEELLASVRRILGSKGRIFYGAFPSEVRPEHVTPTALRLLRQFVANDNLVIGGQSGSDRILSASHRGHSVEAIVSAVRYCREAGFFPNVDLIFGLPGETPADVAASMQLAERLNALGARIHGHAFMPLPGTPYRNEAAGALDAKTQHDLAGLTARGKLYGQWRQQMAIAAQLARQRHH